MNYGKRFLALEKKSYVVFLSQLKNKEERAPINDLLKAALPDARIIDKNKAELIKKIHLIILDIPWREDKKYRCTYN